MTTTTPDMTLVLPDVSITAGPQWATLLNAAFTRIDAHDHSTGNGVKITPSGLNISSDLSFASNNATDLRTLRLFPNNSFTAGASDRTCLYALGGELYYIDASGNSVQITLNGTVDVANAITALSIKDSGFFVQYFGDTTRQFRFNASAIPTGTTRILSVPDSGGNDTFVTQAATQTLTNKTLTAPTISTPAITTSANLTAVTAPLAPAAGTANVYVSSVDGQLHLQNSAGVDTAIGAGSSSGKNYLQSYYGFTLNPVTGAATSLTSTGNRTATQTVFGTSTASAATLITYNTATPLRAPGDLQITFPAAGSGAFVETPMFTLDTIDVNAGVQYVSFESSFLTSGAVAGDVTVVIVQYDASGNYVGVINPSITNIPTQYYKFKAAWSPSSTATAKYSIRFIVNTASARTLDVQDIVVGPQFITDSNAVGSWINYTPIISAGFGTASGVAFKYRRVGDSMEIRGLFTSGTVAASVGTFTLPAGLTIDTAKLPSTTGFMHAFGMYTGTTRATAQVFSTAFDSGVLTYDGTNTDRLQFAFENNAGVYVNEAANNFIGSSYVLDVRGITIPIAQWTSTVTLAGNANIEYASNSSSTDTDDTTSFAYGSTGSAGVIGTTALTATRLKRIRFQTPIQPTDRLVIEYTAPTNVRWSPLNGQDYQTGLSSFEYQTTLTYGLGLKSSYVNSTDIDVVFGTYSGPSTANTYAGTGFAWNTANLSGYRWRVAKYSAVGLAELAPATTTSSGSISRESRWTPFTPGLASGFGTATSNVGYYKVMGDTLFVRGSFVAGTTSASLAAMFIPPGFTINTAVIPLQNTTSNPGSIIGTFANANNANLIGPIVVAPASNATTVYFSQVYTSASLLTPANGNAVVLTGNTVSYSYEIAIL